MVNVFARRVALVLCVAVGSATAAVGPGDIAPEIDSQQSFNAPSTKGVSLGQFRGRVVLIDFWATWCGPCVASIPHLIDLHEKYADKGLVIIGQTDMSSRNLAKFIEQKKIPYIISVGKQMAPPAYGVRGIPHGVVIDATGKVTWVGHPAGLRPSVIEAALKTVSPLAMKGYPSFETTSEDRDVRQIQKYITSGRVGYGMSKLREIVAEPKDDAQAAAAKVVIDVVDAWYAKKKAGAEELEAKGDIYGAAELYELIAKAMKGVQEGDAAAEKEKALKAHEEYKVGQLYSRLAVKLQRAPSAIQKREFAKFAGKYGDSFYGKLAGEMAQ